MASTRQMTNEAISVDSSTPHSDSSISPLDISRWTNVVIWTLIFIPILSYHLRNYRAQQSHTVYRLRYSSITVIQCYLLILKYLAAATNEALLGSSVYELYSPLDYANTTLIRYLAMFFQYCFVAKFYLLRFNIWLHQNLTKYAWKSVIDGTQYSSRRRFYVKHKKSLGSYRRVMLLGLFLTIFFTTIHVIIYLLHWNTSLNQRGEGPWTFYADSDYVVPLFLLMIIYFLTPSFHDN